MKDFIIKQLFCLCMVLLSTVWVQAQILTSTATFQNVPFESKNGIFEVTFDATPLGASIDVVSGLSTAPATVHADVACAVRFKLDGTIVARNGGAWGAVSTVGYTPNTSYHFRLIVDVSSHSYDIYVTPQGEEEVSVGTNFGFRTEQSGVSSLSYLSLSDVEGHGTATLENFTVKDAVTPSDPCMTSSDNFQSRSFDRQNGKFEAAFDVTPLLSTIDVIAGLSMNAASSNSDLACIVRFGLDGNILLRNGSEFKANVSFPYVQNKIYHFRFIVDVPNHKYSVFVTPQDGTETALGVNYSFRSEQGNASSIAYWSVSDVNGKGAADVCNFTFGEYTEEDTTSYTSSSACLNIPFPSSQTGTFETTFKATPLGNNIDVVFGLSENQATGAGDMSCSIRFRQLDGIVARDGNDGWYYKPAPEVDPAYEVNTEYTFRMVVNVPAKTYDAYVTPAGGQEITLKTGLKFRAAASSLVYWNLVDVDGHGTATAKDFAITSPNALKSTKVENGSNLSAYTTASNQVMINYTLDQPGKTILSLYDMSGKLVKTIVNGYKEIGDYEKKYDMMAFPNGIYFINLTQEGRLSGSCKLIK